MEKLIDLAALAEQLGGEEWVYSRTSLHSRGYITGRGGRTIVQTTDGDVPANVCRFIQMADPATILAIAKAYRALEQINAELRRQRAGLTKEANDFEAKLEELAKQKPRYQIQKKPSYGRESVWIDVSSREEAETNVLHGYLWRMVYDAPAPAADLADLVPDAKAIRKEAGGYAPVYSLQEQQLFIDGATWLRAAILRKIEEAK